jgi:hypothetical protein
MSVIEKFHWRRRIAPIGLVAAAALGPLVFSVTGSAHAAFAVASFVIICGYLRNAYIANERDGASGTRFLISSAGLFEFLLAASLVLGGFPITWSLSLLIEFTPAAHVFLPFYAVKLMLTFVLKGKYGISDLERTYFCCLTYSILTVTSVLALEGSIGGGAFSSSRLLSLLVVWFTVPTVTFCLDMRKEHPPSVRYVVWRSAFEILFLCPLFSFPAVFITTLISIVTESFGMFTERLRIPGGRAL